MKKRLALAVALALVLMLAMAAPVLAKGGDTQDKLVVNVTWKQTNTWAWSPNVGVWGLADQIMNMQVRQTGPNSFTQITTMSGTWSTFAGAPSPGAGIGQKHRGSGTICARAALSFTAPALDPQDNLPVWGYRASKLRLLPSGAGLATGHRQLRGHRDPIAEPKR
jgi:hypothetical protein